MISERKATGIIVLVLPLVLSCGQIEETTPNNDTPAQETIDESNDTPGSTLQEADDSWVCRPAGKGPFPGVLYNHGGLGTAIGGDLRATCEALAAAGYLARSEKRPETRSLAGHLDEVLDGLTQLRDHIDADVDHIGIMGFSRGGLLTLQAAIREGNRLQAAILMAPAHGNGQLINSLTDVSSVAAPVEIYVAENDSNSTDHVQLANDIEDALSAAGKTVNLTVYPPYGSDGHMLFDQVQEPYWSDVLRFLEANLQ